jgi:hypothetical protein
MALIPAYFTPPFFTFNLITMSTTATMQKDIYVQSCLNFIFSSGVQLFLSIFLVLAAVSEVPGQAAKTSVHFLSPKNPANFSANLNTTIQLTGAPPIQSVRSFGSGIATHMGKTSFEAASTVNFTVQPATINGTAILTAANGDELHTAFTGTTATAAGTATGNFVHTITGGTGRFSNASGTLKATSIHNLATQKGVLSFEGEIDY